MLEALQIMLAGEFWLSKAMQALFRPDTRMNDCVGALKHDQERLCETAFDQCWHLSLVLYPLHAPLDLKTCSLLEECGSVELLTANPGSQAKLQRQTSVQANAVATSAEKLDKDAIWERSNSGTAEAHARNLSIVR